MQYKSDLIVVENQKFHLMSGNCSYVIGVNPYGYLENYYFGGRIAGVDALQNRSIDRGHIVKLIGSNGEYADASQFFSECACFGQGDYREPSVAVTLPNGSRIFDLKYCSYSILKKDVSGAMPKTRDGETLEIVLSDEVSSLKVALCYTVYPDVNAIVRSARIVNDSAQVISINRAYSFNLDIPNDRYDMISLCGAHLRERYVVRNELSQGVHKIDSKRGISSSQRNPFIALCDKTATEHTGDVFGFSLIYSGSFALNVELSDCNVARVQGGINEFDFEWKLESGKTFETPEAVLVYSNNGLNGMSQAFHDLFREHLISPRDVYQHRPVVINNWEGTYFDFDEAKLMAIIDSVKGTGIDTFVLDDGWFGKRNDDRTSLGDWFINTEKLPNGLRVIADYCHRNQMKFGLWFEPEMVSPDSDLYRKHPEWAICAPERTPCLGRTQMVLDITRKDVLDYLKNTISSLIETVGIDFMKWDCNRCLTEFYSTQLPSERQKEFSHRYVLALYELYQHFEENYPHVMIEGCASGGGRFDAGVLRYSPQIWTSDNSDACARTKIQYGTSFVYPLSSMSCHVSVCPNHQCGRTTDFESRAAIAALGAFGYELDSTKLSESEKEALRKYNQQYLKDEELILRGDLFRLISPFEQNLFAEMVVSKDKSDAILTVMVPLAEANKAFDRIKLYGLDANRQYLCEEEEKHYFGTELINRGFDIPNTFGDFKTIVRHFRAV